MKATKTTTKKASVVASPVKKATKKAVALLAEIEKAPVQDETSAREAFEAAAAAAPVAEPAPKKRAAKKVAPVTPAPEATATAELKIRLYGSQGCFYFGQQARDRISAYSHLMLAFEGRTLTMTPTNVAEGNVPLMKDHAALVIRVKKVLAATGLVAENQNLVATPVGEAGMRVVIA